MEQKVKVIRDLNPPAEETPASKHYDLGVLGVWFGENYGSVATYYALNKVLEGMGRSVLMIDKPLVPGTQDISKLDTHSRRFANEHYDISAVYPVAKLSELNQQLKDLDPAQVKFGKKSFFGKIQDPVKKYFNKYQKAETAIDNIIQSLDNSSKVLQNDNVTLLQEEATLREATDKLMADIELGKMMDDYFDRKDRIALVIMIVDSRIGLTKDDLDMKDYLEAHQLRYLIAANKIDKLSNNQLMNNKHKLFKDMDNVVYVSAEKKKNIQEIKDRIMETLG